MKRTTFLITVLWVILLTASAALAQTTNRWVAGSGKWETTNNWSLGVAPASNQTVFVTNTTTKTVTIDFATTTNSPSAMTVSNLTLSGPANNTNTLFLNDAGTNSPLRVLKNLTINANGELVVTNSVLLVEGALFNIDGSVTNLAGGKVIVTNTTMRIGNAGRGDFTAFGGSLLASNVIVGATSGSQGTLTIAGGTNEVFTTVPFATSFTVGSAANSTGAVWITAGELIVTNSSTLLGDFGIAQMTVTNGTWRAADVHVGGRAGSKGKLTLAGGTTILSIYLEAAALANSTGEVWMTGGQLTATNSLPGLNIGLAGVGQMTVSNGICQTKGVQVGQLTGSQGTLTLVGGTNIVTVQMQLGFQANSTGVVWLVGGYLVATDAFISVGTTGFGQMTVSNGTLLARSVVVATNGAGKGVFSVIGGNVTIGGQTVTNGFRIGDTIGTTGSVQVSSAQLVVTNTSTIIGHLGTGAITVSNGTFMAGQTDIGLGTNSQGSLTLQTNSQMTVSGTLTVGSGSGATGTVDIVGGQLTVTNGTFGIGNDGSLLSTGGVAHVIVSNSTVEAASILVGDNTTNSASGFTVSTNGYVLVSGGLRANGIKTTLIEGGTLEVQAGAPAFEEPALHNRISVGFQGDGRMLLSNGTVRAPEMVVGHMNGRGTFEMAGGAMILSSNLIVGLDASATGTVFITGGSLTVTNGAFAVGNNGTVGGAGGLAHVAVSNGIVEAASILVGDVTGGDSGLTVAGNGYVRAHGGLRSNGIKTTLVNGGTLEVLDEPPPPFEDPILHDRIVVSYLADGKLVVSNGTVRTPGMLVGGSAGNTGTMQLAGGSTSVFSNMTVGFIPCTSTGIVNVVSGSLFVTNGAANAVLEVRSGTFTLSSGTVTVDVLVITNACGHFARNGGSLIISTLVLDPNLDADGDGIPNGYEQGHALDPLNAVNAILDSDGDGLTDLQEFQAGTDPTNNVSAFRITSVVKNGSNMVVTWKTGLGRTNALQAVTATGFTTNMADIFIVTNTVGTVTNYLDVGGATNTPSRYYRIRLVP